MNKRVVNVGKVTGMSSYELAVSLGLFAGTEAEYAQKEQLIYDQMVAYGDDLKKQIEEHGGIGSGDTSYIGSWFEDNDVDSLNEVSESLRTYLTPDTVLYGLPDDVTADNCIFECRPTLTKDSDINLIYQTIYKYQDNGTVDIYYRMQVVNPGDEVQPDNWGDWITLLTGSGSNSVVFCEDYVPSGSGDESEPEPSVGINAHTIDGLTVDDIMNTVDEKNDTVKTELLALKSAMIGVTVVDANTFVFDSRPITGTLNSYNQNLVVCTKTFDNDYIINGNLLMVINNITSGKLTVNVDINDMLVASQVLDLSFASKVTIPVCGKILSGESLSVSINVESEDTSISYSLDGSMLQLNLHGRSEL